TATRRDRRRRRAPPRPPARGPPAWPCRPAGLGVKKRPVPAPIPTAATPVKTVLTRAMDLTGLTWLSRQLGAQELFTSSYFDLAKSPVMTAPTAAAPPTPKTM